MRSAWHLVAAMLAAISMGPLAAEQVKEKDMLVVTTRQGNVAGEAENGLRIFRGIPFAAPPIGSLRWQPPAPPAAWSGVREAKDFAPACVQMPHPVMNVPTQPVSEDCLYLNVWTPATGAGDKLPVLVWIHGGGFAFGSTAMPLFDGAALARKGVVFVSVTYRLGPFGFFAHPELSRESAHGVSGNYGLLDQVAALRWVKDNITAFGGDPERVTIMGESAGGISVCLLVQSPLARGLFEGAISESGASFLIGGGTGRRLAEAEQSGAEFAAKLGAATTADLRALSADAILQAAQDPGALTPRQSWPVYDGYVLPGDDSVLVYRQDRHNDTPILIGNNDREGDFFPHASTVNGFRESVARQFGPLTDKVLAAYPAGDDAEAARSAAALVGDTMFGIQNWIWARLQSRYGKSPVYYYHFDHDPPPREGVPPGPIHGAELPYVFGTMDIRPIGWTAADRALSELLMNYWTNFVKTGDPNGGDLPDWPTFSEESPKVMYFKDGRSQPGQVPHEAQLSSFDPF